MFVTIGPHRMRPNVSIAFFCFIVSFSVAEASASLMVYPQLEPVIVMFRPFPIWAATGGMAKRANSAIARVENIGRSVFMVVMFCGFIG